MLSRSGWISGVFVALSLTGCVVVVTQTQKPGSEKLLSPPASKMVQNTRPMIFYVDPQIGSDQPKAGHSQETPLRTITYRLEQAT